MPLATANFREAEFYIHERPPADIIRSRLPQMMRLAQWLRDLAQSPGIVNSYYRSPARNARVGGVDHSAHMTGDGVDIQFPLIPLREMGRRILASVRTGSAPRFGEIILYNDLLHIHITNAGVGGNMELLYSPGKRADGSRMYLPLVAPDDLPTWSAPQKKASARRRRGWPSRSSS